jgi:hypothetical protein
LQQFNCCKVEHFYQSIKTAAPSIPEGETKDDVMITNKLLLKGDRQMLLILPALPF